MMKHVEIVNKDGKVLRGYYSDPENFNGDVVVCFHGFTGNKTEHACHFRNIARLLEKEGIGTLRMDFSGNGESDGEFKDFTFDTLLPEAHQMSDWAKSVKGFKRLIVLGFSMGGAVAGTMSALRSDEIHKVVLWSPAGNMVELMNRHFEKEGNKLENGNVQYGSFELAKEMYETIQKWKTYEGLDNFKGKVMIIQGKKDLSVPYLFAARYAVSYKNSHLYYVDGAGHGYDAPEHSSKLYNLTVEFLKNE